jgi:hypothetical protein
MSEIPTPASITNIAAARPSMSPGQPHQPARPALLCPHHDLEVDEHHAKNGDGTCQVEPGNS